MRRINCEQIKYLSRFTQVNSSEKAFILRLDGQQMKNKNECGRPFALAKENKKTEKTKYGKYFKFIRFR